MINELIAPHGGALIINMAGESERAALQERAGSLPHLEVGSRQLADLDWLTWKCLPSAPIAHCVAS